MRLLTQSIFEYASANLTIPAPTTLLFLIANFHKQNNSHSNALINMFLMKNFTYSLLSSTSKIKTASQHFALFVRRRPLLKRIAKYFIYRYPTLGDKILILSNPFPFAPIKSPRIEIKKFEDLLSIRIIRAASLSEHKTSVSNVFFLNVSGDVRE